tara:strand:- start:3465 stop:4361 length:897 start_codon:yes stop_codon:yes gene_type:complete
VDVNADVRRANALQAMSVNPFGKNYPNDVNSPIVKRAVPGYNPGNQLHHRAIVSVYEPFFTGLTPNEQLALVEELQSMGVNVGNNPANITAILADDHQGGIHTRTKDYGFEIKRDDLRAKEGANEFLDKIRNSSYNERVAMLPDLVKYGQDEVDRILRDEIGYAVPSRQDQIRKYQSAVDTEHRGIVDQYNRNKIATDMGISPEFNKRDLTKLLSILTSGEVDPSFTGKAGDKIKSVLSGKNVSDSQGAVVGQKPLVINADEGSKVYVHTNGNGNGHSEVQKAFNEANGSSGKLRRRG